MDEVFDEMAGDGVENRKHDEDGYEQVEDVGWQVDSIPRRWDIRLKKHCAIFLFVTDV